MLIGVYLLMPILSPWAEKVSKKELTVYLCIWLFSTMIPILRDWVSADPLAVTYGPTGIPRQALYPMWGEASWNTYGMFYYISGFIGYLLLGLYFRRFVGELSWGRTLSVALPCWLAGFAITFLGFLKRVNETSGGIFPVEGNVSMAVYWETTWCNDTIGVVLMTIAWILLFKKISCSGKFYNKVLLPVSKASYGMYLLHLLILVPVSGAVHGWFVADGEGLLAFWTTPVEIILTTCISFAAVAIVSVIIQRIPKIGKYIMG
jgi:surface polysaccharide O-acyltransferase-like enzyme